MEQKRIFFPNLDGLRFFCFLSVFLFHTWSLIYNGATVTTGLHLFENGNLGVNFFFALSGYLITYLLIAEKEANGRVNIPKFWMRRILRIWPLYFLCVFLGFVAIPFVLQLAGKPQTPTASVLSYITFTSNFDYIRNGYPGSTILEVLWSISVEEQFYFFWPLLLSIVPRRYYIALFSSIAIGSIVFRLVNTERVMHDIHTFSCIGDMAIGAMGALASFSAKVTGFFRRLSKNVVLMIYLALFSFFFFRSEIFYHGIFLRAIDRTLIATAFLFLILEQNYSLRSFFKFSRFKKVSQLGVISYGLYCYHELAITIVFVGINFLGAGTGILTNSGKIVLSLATTIVMAMISYRFFETPFLRLKNRYSFFLKRDDTLKNQLQKEK